MPITDDNRHLALEANDHIANAGERVMVVAQRDLDPQVVQAGGNLIDQVHDLTLLAMVGIVDPPRPEAKAAIAECRDGRHPGPDDHRRPRHHRRRDRQRTRHRGSGDHRGASSPR